MKNSIMIAAIFLLISLSSCIDRDTIAGTGKQDPDRIISAGGGYQTGTVNSTLPVPVSVRVYDANNRPVRGVRVEFFAPNGNAAFSEIVAVTDGDGYAKTLVKLGQKEDSVIVHAIVPGIKGSPVVFYLYAVNAGAQNISIKSGNDQIGTVGTLLPNPLTVEVKDPFNNPVKNALVYFITAGAGKVDPSQALTDSLGIARGYWTTDIISGDQTVDARITATQSSFVTFKASVRALSVPAAYEKLSKDTVVGLQGKTTMNAIIIKVKDAYGNPIRSYQNPVTGVFSGGIFVRFKIESGGGKVPANALQTDETGIIRCTFDHDQFGSKTAVQGYDIGDNAIPGLAYTLYTYEYISIDSAISSGGSVRLTWIKNTNPLFQSYTVERCANSNFDQTTVLLGAVTDENITTYTDNTAPVGTSPYYRLNIFYKNGYSMYSYNIKQVTVLP